MQCAFCILCALMLGAKDATIAVAIYLAMGLVGIPIFTAGGGVSSPSLLRNTSGTTRYATKDATTHQTQSVGRNTAQGI